MLHARPLDPISLLTPDHGTTDLTKQKKASKSGSAKDASFEESLAKLEEIVRQLEEGQLGLSDSLVRYEEGMRLLNQCQQMLAAAERKIEVLRGFDAAGNPITHPLADEEMTLEEKADTRSQRRSARPEVAEVPEDVVDDDLPGSSPEPDDVDFRDTLF